MEQVWIGTILRSAAKSFGAQPRRLYGKRAEGGGCGVREFVELAVKLASSVSVIIPTILAPEREASLERAVRSLRDNVDVEAVPIVVANGRARSSLSFERWRRDARVRFFYIEEPSLPAAIRYGRSRVECPYFSFLDDDDLYLPRALDHRVVGIEGDGETPGFDAFVTNGFR